MDMTVPTVIHTTVHSVYVRKHLYVPAALTTHPLIAVNKVRALHVPAGIRIIVPLKYA